VKSDEELARSSLLRGIDNPRLTISTQLVQIAKSMHHIDELFLWLAQEMIQRLHVQIIQFWATQTYRTGLFSLELRATVLQDTSLPHYIVINGQVAGIARRTYTELRGSTTLQPVGSIFSLHQTTLLRRYGLNYWWAHSLHSNVLLPPASNDPSMEKIATPLSLLVFVFLRHTPPPGVLPTISRILEQAIPIASSRGLFLPAATDPSQQFPPLAELIPHRVRNAEALRSSNPFTSTPVIPDRQARRLYLAIDDQASVLALSASTQLPIKDLLAALRMLLAQNLIQLFDSTGQPVDSSLFLNYLETGL
jgi:hypothetical protein